MEHPNAALGRRFLQALDDKDFGTVEAMVVENVVAHFPGGNKISGTYKGRDQLFAVFAKGEQLTGETFQREVHDVTASDDHIVILVSISAQRDGKQINWNGANVWHVRDGRFTEVWLLSDDQAATDAAFA